MLQSLLDFYVNCIIILEIANVLVESDRRMFPLLSIVSRKPSLISRLVLAQP
jgi:hypothetical protein